MRDLTTLPKAHLHLHLDGAIRQDTLREECERAGIAPPSLPPGRSYGSFEVFMATITACHHILSSPEGLRRVMDEVLEDAARDGAVWVEVSLWPGLFAGRLGSPRDAVHLALEEGRAAAARTGVGFGLMVAANRHHGPEAAIDVARLAVELAADGVVSFGLDGDEAAFPPAPFAPAFAVARAGGLLSTPHAGELLGWESVADAMTVLGADRILHGVRALESPDLVARLGASGVTLDVCPTSNRKLGVVAPDDHPLPALLHAGVRCSLNADDPLLFGTTLVEEYEHGRTACSLSDHDLAEVARTSVTSSGAPDALKARALAGIDEWIGDGPR